MKKNIYVRPAAFSVELQSDENLLLGLSKAEETGTDTGGSEALSRNKGWCSTDWTTPDGYWTGFDEPEY